MGKREIPLFIFDLHRDHNLGECDFVTCTDIDNGFVAKIDYVTNVDSVITDTIRIIKENGPIKLRIEVRRITGKNPDKAAIKTLLKKAEDLYCERTQKHVNFDKPSRKEMVNFLGVLINGNKHHLADAGSDYNERKTLLTSITMLEAIKDELEHGTI